MATRHVLLVLALAANGCATDDEHATEPTGTGSGKADDPAAPSFLASLPGWGRYIVLDKLDEIVPVYLAETRSVLAKIDALPGSAVAETTHLDEVPIADLFASGNVALRAVLNDADFAGGRGEHDVAWLRQSAVALAAFQEAIDQRIADGTSPASFNTHLTNETYWKGPNGAVEISVGIAAVSRFYCNLDVRITNDPSDGFSVDATESCD